MAEVAPGMSKKPADFLKSIKGKPVMVKLSSGVDYRGEQGGLEGAAPWQQAPQLLQFLQQQRTPSTMCKSWPHLDQSQ
jgi:hypothetical protein